MRYVESRAKQDDRDETYRIYVTESLRSITGMKKSYFDLIKPEIEESRTPEEIVTHISDKLSRLGERK